MDMSAHALYFEVAAVVTTFLLLGRYLEANAKQQAGNALKALLNLGAKEATVIRDGAEVRVSADRLQPGDVFLVRPGEKIATDGFVVDGQSAVDTSLITGESLPVDIGPHDTVIGATINTNGRLLVKATRVGSETTLAQMGKLVSQAQNGKAPIARLADRISAVFVPIVLAIAAATFTVWMLAGGDLQSAFTAAVAVLVIACPCALGLATPTALLTGTGRGAQMGILIKGPQVLEDTRTVNTIVLDKTGTVTTGRLTVAGVHSLAGIGEGEILAAGRCRRSRQRASHRPGHRPRCPSQGPAAASDRLRQRTGRRRPRHRRRAPGRLPDGPGGCRPTALTSRTTITLRCRRGSSDGATAIWVGVDGEAAGIISLTDTVKNGSAAAISSAQEPWACARSC